MQETTTSITYRPTNSISLPSNVTPSAANVLRDLFQARPQESFVGPGNAQAAMFPAVTAAAGSSGTPLDAAIPATFFPPYTVPQYMAGYAVPRQGSSTGSRTQPMRQGGMSPGQMAAASLELARQYMALAPLVLQALQEGASVGGLQPADDGNR